MAFEIYISFKLACFSTSKSIAPGVLRVMDFIYLYSIILVQTNCIHTYMLHKVIIVIMSNKANNALHSWPIHQFVSRINPSYALTDPQTPLLATAPE